MKKRLRKKKHLAEFTEWGIDLAIKRTTSDGFDEFLDAFIEAVEANDCFCGGGGSDDHLSVAVELGRSREIGQERLAGIKKWLDSRADIKRYRVGDLTDMCNGDEKAWDEELQRSDAFLKEE